VAVPYPTGDELLQLARTLLDEGGVLLDVRTGPEYRELHVPGAVHIPIDELGRSLPRLLKLVDYDRHHPVIVYCRRGIRSRRAVQLLRQAGFTNVWDLGGVETDPLAGLIARGERLWLRPPPDLRPILYQFYLDHPFVQSGDGAWNRLAWSMGLRSGRDAEQLAYQALGATVPVPGLGPYQPYRQRALLDYTRGQIQAATAGSAFEPWQQF